MNVKAQSIDNKVTEGDLVNCVQFFLRNSGGARGVRSISVETRR